MYFTIRIGVNYKNWCKLQEFIKNSRYNLNKTEHKKALHVIQGICCNKNMRHVDGLSKDCGNFIVNALELPHSCAKPLICNHVTNHVPLRRIII